MGEYNLAKIKVEGSNPFNCCFNEKDNKNMGINSINKHSSLTLKKKIENSILNSGKKHKVELIIKDVAKQLNSINNKSNLKIFRLSIINNLKIFLFKTPKFKNRKKKKSNFLHIPYIIKKKNRITHSLNMLLKSKKQKQGYTPALTKKILET